MLIKEVFEIASKDDYTDLQALIMFLVFEKKVLTMEDDAKELDLYLLDKHKERMNKELTSYKEKMNMKYKVQVYEVKNKFGTQYIKAHSEKQARYLAGENLVPVDEIKICDKNQLMTFNGRDMTLATLIEGKKPSTLGGH